MCTNYYFQQTTTRACENWTMTTASGLKKRSFDVAFKLAIEQATAALLVLHADGDENDSDPFANLDDKEDDDELLATRLSLKIVKLSTE